ncbi:glutaredoxin domain-containing protein [Thermomonas fusca]|uniref:glutaredoxin domain-containing protein n=1 Tax=Thermomonas fusca TaxID=215690 RepID=UPI0014874681
MVQNHSKNIAPANYSEIFIAEHLDPKVPVVITLTTCEACKASKIWLGENNISHIELDIQKNERLAKRLLKAVNASAVPVLLTQKGAIVGFDSAQWKKSIQSN